MNQKRSTIVKSPHWLKKQPPLPTPTHSPKRQLHLQLTHLRGLDRVNMALRNPPFVHRLHLHVARALAAIGASYRGLTLMLVAEWTI